MKHIKGINEIYGSSPDNNHQDNFSEDEKKIHKLSL